MSRRKRLLHFGYATPNYEDWDAVLLFLRATRKIAGYQSLRHFNRTFRKTTGEASTRLSGQRYELRQEDYEDLESSELCSQGLSRRSHAPGSLQRLPN